MLLLLRAISSVHAGAGDGLGFIDKPIQRRADNQHPKIEGSSLKGVLREAFEALLGKNDTNIQAVFGPEGQDESQKSAMNVQDGRILLFPVSSPVGNTLYITCPAVLNLFNAEQKRMTANQWPLTAIPTISNIENAYTLGGQQNGEISINSKLLLQKNLLIAKPLETKIADSAISQWLATALFPDTNDFYHEFYKNRIVVVNDTLFTFFVRYRTEVITGNRIKNETGVVATGALFNYEYLPEGTVLYTWLESGPERKKGGLTDTETYSFLKQGFQNSPTYLTLGGRTSVGKGQMAVTLKETVTLTNKLQ